MLLAARILVLTLFFISFNLGEYRAMAQNIVDPCFASIEILGKFSGSDDLVNACMKCPDPFEAADLIEWNGTEWDGAIPHSDIYLPPPPGCNQRAIWMGYYDWTFGGESFALRLDAPLVAGVEYRYTFTYASAGGTGDGNFSPKFYANSTANLKTAIYIERLPGVNGWTTNTFIFTALPSQAGHTWIFLHAVESSGMILGQCDFTQLFPGQTILGEDGVICEGQRIELSPPYSKNSLYQWSTGESTPSVEITEPGEYSVKIQYGSCEALDTVKMTLQDCDVRLVMPNVITPNRDSYNERFVPKEHNFVDKGITRIYNRWGEEVFTGDLFEGWDGCKDSRETAPGIYYYVVDFTDGNQRKHLIKGYVSVVL